MESTDKVILRFENAILKAKTNINQDYLNPSYIEKNQRNEFVRNELSQRLERLLKFRGRIGGYVWHRENSFSYFLDLEEQDVLNKVSGDAVIFTQTMFENLVGNFLNYWQGMEVEYLSETANLCPASTSLISNLVMQWQNSERQNLIKFYKETLIR